MNSHMDNRRAVRANLALIKKQSQEMAAKLALVINPKR